MGARYKAGKIQREGRGGFFCSSVLWENDFAKCFSALFPVYVVICRLSGTQADFVPYSCNSFQEMTHFFVFFSLLFLPCVRETHSAEVSFLPGIENLTCFCLRRSPDHGTVNVVVVDDDFGAILTFKKVMFCAKLIKPKLQILVW